MWARKKIVRAHAQEGLTVVDLMKSDRSPGRKIWFGALDDTVNGLQLHGKVKMKPTMLRTAPDYWTRVEAEEILYLDGRGDVIHWVTVRGTLADLDSHSLDEALARATRIGVFVRISETCAVAPARIRGLMRDESGYKIEVDTPSGEGELLTLDRKRIPELEECLEVLSSGSCLLFADPEDFED